jgi:hypothetical protein
LKALALPKSLHYFDPNPGFLRSQDLMVTWAFQEILCGAQQDLPQ